MSKDVCYDSMHNIWQLSQIRLPQSLRNCKCMITHQSTNNPKLIILGGIAGEYGEYKKTFLEYNLSDILDVATFLRFMFNFKKVKQTQKQMCIVFIFFCFINLS